MSLLTCKSGCDLKGKPIPQEYIDKGMYGDLPPAERFYSRLIGIEDGTYDGVSWWHCPDCGGTWNRWTGEMRDA